MRRQEFLEKIRKLKIDVQSKSGIATIIVSQHVLLWTSLYVLACSAYIVAEAARDGGTLTGTLLMMVSACISTSHVGFHNFSSYLAARQPTESSDKSKLHFQRLSKICIRLGVVIWLIACGFVITFTVARHASCVPSRTANTNDIDVGRICYIQRSTLAAGSLALLISGVLFVLVCKIQDPFRCHMFGVVKSRTILPFLLPYKTSSNGPMFSEMSFKCRSSTSLSSKTLVPSFTNSRTTLLPTTPDRAGLGICASKSSAPSFLAPRPSLSSIRSYTEAISTQPPSFPTPPLPTYCRETRPRASVVYNAGHPPPLPVRYKRVTRERTLRIVPPSPTLLASNLGAFNPSQMSLSSVYSQDIDGKRYTTGIEQRAAEVTRNGRDYNSNSTSTILMSPLGTMKLIDYEGTFPKVVMNPTQVDERSDSDIDDAATLQAKLPNVRAVSDFGDVEKWSCGSQTAANYYQRLIQPGEGGCRRQLSLKPLMMRKTRNSAAVRAMI